MIAASELVRLFRFALDGRWGYVWGTAGQVWTQAKQNAASRDMTVRYGTRWIGRNVADCSGLFVWAYKQHDHKIYHGSNTIYNKHTSKTGALYGEVEILPGTAVFQVVDGRRTHIGLYVGDGSVIEARGTKSGVIESDLSEWDEWGLLTDVDYDGVEAEVIVIDTLKTLRKGDSGLTVSWLQEALLAAGYALGEADGKYGAKTEAAVKAFQRASGLTADGIAGKLTIAALTALGESEPEEKPEDDEPAEGQMTLEEKVERLWDWMMSSKGGGGDESA